MNDSFENDNKLLIDIIYKSVNSFNSFIYAKAVFPDKWYNFIIPLVSPSKLDWNHVQKVKDDEGNNGVELSFYINEKLKDEYRTYFENKQISNYLGSDFGVYFKNNKYDSKVGSLVEVNSATLEDYLQIASVCFSDWIGNRDYGNYFFNLNQTRPDLLVKNYLYRVNNTNVGAGSIVGSSKLDLAYIHNTGILPEFRRKGYFTEMIRQFTNVIKDNNISTSYALVDEDGASFAALQKIGFKTKHKYYLFGMI